MASGYKVFLPNGPAVIYALRPGQTWKDVVTNHLMPAWLDYCNRNWLSDNHEQTYCGENKVKAFLNQCAYLLTLDNPKGLESAYRKNRHETMEIPVSSAPSEIEDVFYSAVKPPMVNAVDEQTAFDVMLDKLDGKAMYVKKPTEKKRKSTRFDKMRELLQKHSGSKIETARVDTEGCFQYDGHTYKLSPDEESYQGEWQPNGEKFYMMDTVMIVRDGDQTIYYDMALNMLTHEVRMVS